MTRPRDLCTTPTRPDEVCGADFVQDELAWGRNLGMLTVEDLHTRETRVIEVDATLSGKRVTRVLDHFITERGQALAAVVLDNGPELTSKVPDRWAYDRDVRLHVIDPGKTIQNGLVERF